MEIDELPCPMCKEAIKASALKCKHCQHELTYDEVEARKKEKQEGQAAGFGCLAILILALFLSFCTGSDESEPSAATLAEKAENKRKGLHCLSNWDGAHPAFERKVKAQLRDPDSYEHVSTKVTPVEDGRHTIFMEYRARNGFGGLNLGTVVGSYDNETCESSEPTFPE